MTAEMSTVYLLGAAVETQAARDGGDTIERELRAAKKHAVQ
jgi:hypothetical protein